LRFSGGGGPVAAHGVVGGLHTAPALIEALTPQEGLQYALTPLGAQALLGVPAVELSGYAVDLVDVVGSRANRLLAELHDAPEWSERFRLVDDTLLERLGGDDVAIPPEVAEAWRMIFASDGRIRVGTLATHVGWGRRHLSERFRIATGVTPKQAARIARFESVRAVLTDPRRPSLAEIAVRCGYADQAHLAREWRALAGCSIGTWLREELPFIQDHSLADAAESLA
jgi:AraC-like DNA-binding protein